MKTQKAYSVILVTTFVIIASLSVAFQAQKINVTGTWNMTVESSLGSGTPVLVLKQTNDSVITGTYSGQLGDVNLSGILRKDKIILKIPVTDLMMEYTGTVEGSAMKGKVIFASYGEGTFTGKKKE